MFGTVKWFSTEKGYGFIAPENGGADVFIHIRDLNKSGLQSLREGERVSYEMQNNPNGKQSASNVKLAV